jgi:hypothetical protein
MDSLYPIAKDLHSYIRWIVLILAIVVIVKYLIGWLQKKSFTQTDNRLGLFLIITIDIQLLLGLSLYFFYQSCYA